MVSVLAGSGQAEVGHCLKPCCDSHPPSSPIPAGSGAGSTLRSPPTSRVACPTLRPRGCPGGAAILGVGVEVRRPGSSWIMASSSVTWGALWARLLTVCLRPGVSPGSRVGAARPLVRGHILTLTHLSASPTLDLVPKPPTRMRKLRRGNSLQGLDTG